MAKEILCTLGPASMNERTITRLTALGVALFRLNLSHTKLQDVAPLIEKVRALTAVPLCLDTEGAQIRTGNFVSGSVEVKENGLIYAHRQPVPGDASHFNFYPMEIIDEMVPGDLIAIDFNEVLVQVTGKDAKKLEMRVLQGGKIGRNKAVTVKRDIDLPALTEKDVKALEIGKTMGIRHAALSFANRASDVDELRRHAAPGTFVISKIECRNGLLNLDAIAARSDALLIDRGDLSRQEPIERIPFLQKKIIRHAKKAGKKVYVATNLLESMVTSPNPTRAEVNDVINTLADGADGLVLAAETAIGQDPIGCAHMIAKLIHEYENCSADDRPYCPQDAKSFLVAPHGGRLVNRENTVDFSRVGRCPRVAVEKSILMDCEQIALGTYSPLTGFMGKETLASVLSRHRLPDGTAWTMPILWQVPESLAKKTSKGERLALTDESGVVHALVEMSEVYRLDIPEVSKAWFGTSSGEHPGVEAFQRGGPWVIAGSVDLIQRRRVPYGQYQWTPAQSRLIFEHKGWSQVVGFHTRNVIHRAHEYIQLKALERTHADGLYISPIIGSERRGDFLPEWVIRSYQAMMDFSFYPPGRVLVGCLATYPRFSGPREAVFTALCRKNMGCSHFIVGRNHSGVGDFYDDREYRKLFDSLNDLGMTPVFFDQVGYDADKKVYESAGGPGSAHQMISGTQVRAAFKENRPLPDWFMREEIQNLLRSERAAGGSLFCE
ncbi:MAG: sulfate adenylyltransferase [Candidatus Omnitrophica bacterium]|nr:sulfate adenylyltransferase [Candidatus Omnitrophota bacterium]